MIIIPVLVKIFMLFFIITKSLNVEHGQAAVDQNIPYQPNDLGRLEAVIIFAHIGNIFVALLIYCYWY